MKTIRRRIKILEGKVSISQTDITKLFDKVKELEKIIFLKDNKPKFKPFDIVLFNTMNLRYGGSGGVTIEPYGDACIILDVKLIYEYRWKHAYMIKDDNGTIKEAMEGNLTSFTAVQRKEYEEQIINLKQYKIQVQQT